MNTTQANPFRSTSLPLPEELESAIAAIDLPEVQAMMKKLARFNLGVCLPHKHAEETGDFILLPDDEIQMEDDLHVTFLDRASAAQQKAIPVAWRWKDDGVSASAVCVSGCTSSSSQSGGDRHISWHNKH